MPWQTGTPSEVACFHPFRTSCAPGIRANLLEEIKNVVGQLAMFSTMHMQMHLKQDRAGTARASTIGANTHPPTKVPGATMPPKSCASAFMLGTPLDKPLGVAPEDAIVFRSVTSSVAGTAEGVSRPGAVPA